MSICWWGFTPIEMDDDLVENVEVADADGNPLAVESFGMDL